MATAGSRPSLKPHIGLGWRHPHYAQMLEQKPELDFLEVHSENFFHAGGAALAVLEQGRANYPISLHGVGLSLGSALGVDPWHLDQLANLVKRVDPVRVSDHAAFARATLRGTSVHAADLLPIPFSIEALWLMCANVQQVQDRLQRPLLVENLSAYVYFEVPEAEKALSEPYFLSELSRRTGCQLLVDVNNIYVNALNARIQDPALEPMQFCREWLDAIPPNRVGEIHLAGHCHVNDEHGEIVVDDHGSQVCGEVWTLYRHAMQRFGAVPTLVEWDTDVPSLEVLLQEARTARSCAVSEVVGLSV